MSRQAQQPRTPVRCRTEPQALLQVVLGRALNFRQLRCQAEVEVNVLALRLPGSGRSERI
jgi:hypothetical protein